MEVGRIWAWAVVAAAGLATASPLVPAFRGERGDSFPLSWFPMFAGERPSYEHPTYVIGLTADGDRVKIDTTFWTTGGMHQGRTMLLEIVKSGRAMNTCKAIAAKVATRKRAPLDRVVEVRIVRGVYQRESFYAGDSLPIRESRIARCDVSR